MMIADAYRKRQGYEVISSKQLCWTVISLLLIVLLVGIWDLFLDFILRRGTVSHVPLFT